MKSDGLQPLSPQAKRLKTGLYRHYSGKEYSVLFVARHSETLEEVVVYRANYGVKDYWVRPLRMFVEKVEVGSELVPRFTYLG